MIADHKERVAFPKGPAVQYPAQHVYSEPDGSIPDRMVGGTGTVLKSDARLIRLVEFFIS